MNSYDKLLAEAYGYVDGAEDKIKKISVHVPRDLISDAPIPHAGSKGALDVKAWDMKILSNIVGEKIGDITATTNQKGVTAISYLVPDIDTAKKHVDKYNAHANKKFARNTDRVGSATGRDSSGKVVWAYPEWVAKHYRV